jgi:glutamate/tyrosine decarboxylase-like PLP-dependent enzyme
MILEDTQKGLIPFMYHGTYGSTLTNAIDISSEAIALAKKYNMWVSIDAVSMGTSFLLKENQLPESFFEKVDSTFVNFSKNLLVGNGGALLFVGDRAEF